MKPEEYEKMYLFEEENWWYKGRRELLLEIISGIRAGAGNGSFRILDAGCGTGLTLKLLERYGDAEGIDISKEALRLCRSRGAVSLAWASGESLPFREGSFQAVCALDVIEHIEDDRSALREFGRVLCPEGHLILTVPAFQFLWSDHDRAVHHKRRYTRGELVEKLKSSGFEVSRASYWNFFLFPGVALVRTLRRDEPDQESSDLNEIHSILNRALISILRLERLLIKAGISLPVGVSIICVCRKGGGGPLQS